MRALPLVVALLMLAAPVGAGFASADADAQPVVEGPDSAADAGTVDGPDSAADAGTVDGPDPAAHAGTVDGPDPAAHAGTTVQNDTPTHRVLTVQPGVDSTVGLEQHAGDLGPTLALEVHAADAAMRTAAVERHVESAESNAERQRRILAAVNRIEQDEVTLNQRQRDAIAAHAAGELSDRELLVELARIAAVAEEYDERRATLDELAEETDDFSPPGRLAELQVQLDVYDGPVRQYALETLRGEAEADRIYVETAGDALVLTAIDGDEYVREVHRGDRWDRGGGSIDGEVAINVTATSYPETTAEREGNAFGAGSIQRITVPHADGELRTYVSGGSEQVFVEHQRIDLDGFADADAVSTSEDGFNLTVDRTYAGGPLRVTVLDEETGDPVGGVPVTMSVAGDGDSEEIGTTDADGQLWTLSPAASYQITVVDGTDVARITDIQPADPPRVTDESEPDEE